MLCYAMLCCAMLCYAVPAVVQCIQTKSLYTLSCNSVMGPMSLLYCILVHQTKQMKVVEVPRWCRRRVMTNRRYIQCCAVLCCAILCYAMLCYAMLCYAMLYYAVPAVVQYIQTKS